MADDPAFFGIGAQQAQVIASGGFGAMVLMHLRHPGTVLRAAGTLVTGVGVASVFTDSAMALSPVWLGFGKVQVAAVLGLAGNALAAGVLKAIEHVDLSGLLARRKGV